MYLIDVYRTFDAVRPNTNETVENYQNEKIKHFFFSFVATYTTVTRDSHRNAAKALEYLLEPVLGSKRLD